MGLVDMLLHRLPWFFVQELQKVYSAVPISTVASELGLPPENAHAYLEHLISGRLLNASIEYPQDGQAILRFYPNLSSGPLAKTEQQHHRAIVEQKIRIDKLSDQVRMADARMSVTRYWVDHLKKKKDKNEEGAEREQAEQLSWTATGDADVDEDLMDSMDMA
jgi:COP9 signalosome complex subunit 3